MDLQAFQGWPALITALIAVYGAALSTYTFILNLREKQRQVSVSLSGGFLTYRRDVSEPMLFVEIRNPGARTVTINVPAIRLPDGKSMVFLSPDSDVSFPYELKEGGKDCRVWMEMREMARELLRAGYSGKVKVSAEVKDGAGKVYRSKKPYTLDLNAFGR